MCSFYRPSVFTITLGSYLKLDSHLSKKNCVTCVVENPFKMMIQYTYHSKSYEQKQRDNETGSTNRI